MGDMADWVNDDTPPEGDLEQKDVCEERIKDDPRFWSAVLELRGVYGETCSACRGLGRYYYFHGSTWRGGMATAGGAWDVCDRCWGSGSEDDPGMDLREMTAQRKRWQEDQVLMWLADRLGLSFGDTRKRILALAEMCRKQSRRRKIPEGEDWWSWVYGWERLTEVLERIVR